jgi:hypothetical protein
MKVYGYWDKKTRFIFGPGNFEIDSAKGELTPFYTQPIYEGQEPFACIKSDVGIFLHYPKYIGQYDLVPVYQG